MSSDQSLFTVQEVARLAGVTVRTLHFYDEQGVLKPAFVGSNGYRYYQREELQALQDILFYRELDVSLEEIKRILGSSSYERLASLKAHEHALLDRAKRLERLVGTLRKTIKTLEGTISMKAYELFEGFDPEKQARHEKDLEARLGPAVVAHLDESKRRIANHDRESLKAVMEDAAKLNEDLASLMRSRIEPDDQRVQAVVKRHYEWICEFWTPNQESYAGLASLYEEHPEFRAFYERIAEGLTSYLSRAMRVYAQRLL